MAEDEDKDEDIRAALRRRDFECAFRRLRERHGQGIYRACYAVLRQEDLAYEAMQDTFEKMVRKHHLLAGADSIRAYALQMAKNTALDMLRKAMRRRDLDREHQRVEPEGAVMPDQASSDEAAVNKALQECLDETDPATHKALLLHQDDMPWRDIAREVGLSEDAIRMRVSRVLKDLKKCLERKGFQP